MLPVGKLTCEQMRGLASIAQQFGDGDIRLTVWQNLLISGVPTAKIQDAEAAVEKLGLTTKASSIRSGLVACTGNAGCRFAASDTKRHAEDIARWCEERVELDGPVNIHLTGCHHSCAQHYIGDIGLIACKVSVNDDGDTVEGYHILVGGGFGPRRGPRPRNLQGREGARTRRRSSSACSRPISRSAPRPPRRSRPSPAAMKFPR